MTWRWSGVVLATLWMVGCGEATVRPFAYKSDAGVDASVDAGEDDAGEDDDFDGGEENGDEEDGGEEDGGEEDGGEE